MSNLQCRIPRSTVKVKKKKHSISNARNIHDDLIKTKPPEKSIRIHENTKGRSGWKLARVQPELRRIECNRVRASKSEAENKMASKKKRNRRQGGDSFAMNRRRSIGSVSLAVLRPARWPHLHTSFLFGVSHLHAMSLICIVSSVALFPSVWWLFLFSLAPHRRFDLFSLLWRFIFGRPRSTLYCSTRNEEAAAFH